MSNSGAAERPDFGMERYSKVFRRAFPNACKVHAAVFDDFNTHDLWQYFHSGVSVNNRTFYPVGLLAGVNWIANGAPSPH
jgi:hypothetical protein